MNDKIISSVFVALALLTAPVVSAVSGAEPKALIPDAPIADYPRIELDLPQTAAETVIVAPKPAPKPAPVRTWTCGAPRGLASDEVATVRVCEWR